jgi:hypothetical protein
MAPSVRAALAIGLALMATALIVVLSQSPLTVAGTNSIPAYKAVASAAGGSGGCQPSGTMPRGTSAIRISASANTGPRVTVKALSGAQLITSGERDAVWGVDETVTVPVKRVPRAIPNTSICIAFGPTVEHIQINGALVPTTSASGQSGRALMFRVEYLRPGHSSWWSLASSVARRIGLGHAAAGTWIVFALIALMVAVIALASWLLLSGDATGRAPAADAGKSQRRIPRVLGPIARALRRLPRAAWICALIACLNAICWSVLTPPFQVPDEPAHFAYVQQIAETGTLPTPAGNPNYASQEELVALRDLHQAQVRWYPEKHPVDTQAQQRRLQEDLAQPLGRTGAGGAGVATSQPPLYYALATIPYGLGSGGTLLDRLELMRLLSALMAGLTALFAYLFVREAVPGVAWAWSVGGLGVALAPALGLMGGAVNPDAMLFAVSAATFYLLALAFRRGLTPRLAIAIGVVTAIGLLSKVNFIGLVPGVGVGLLVLALRAARTSRRTAYRSLALAVTIAASPVCLYLLINLFSNHAGLGVVSSAIHLTNERGSVLDEISYIWQSYLPRLPGMANDFPGISTTRQVWFDRSIGFYGWNDTSFPVWVESIALIPAALLAILAIRALVTVRATVRRRLVELAVYALMGAGLLALIGADSYLVPGEPGTYSEPRYLLPLLPLLGAALVLSARGAGRRWGPVAGALIVVLFLAHDVFSQLQVTARFYG